MATYGEAVDLVISQLGRSDVSITSFVQREFLNAIEHYSTQRFWFNEGTTTFTTSSSLATYSGTGILEVDTVVATIAGTRFPLRRENPSVLEYMDTGLVFGQPCVYSWFNESFRLYPVPDATYTIAVQHHTKFTELSGTASTNAFLSSGLELITARVKKNMFAYRYKDYDSARACEQIERDALDRLLAQTTRNTSTGRLSPG